jgi:hypothetical protein
MFWARKRMKSADVGATSIQCAVAPETYGKEAESGAVEPNGSFGSACTPGGGGGLQRQDGCNRKTQERLE